MLCYNLFIYFFNAALQRGSYHPVSRTLVTSIQAQLQKGSSPSAATESTGSQRGESGAV